jgi:hypothetical protein
MFLRIRALVSHLWDIWQRREHREQWEQRTKGTPTARTGGEYRRRKEDRGSHARRSHRATATRNGRAITTGTLEIHHLQSCESSNSNLLEITREAYQRRGPVGGGCWLGPVGDGRPGRAGREGQPGLDFLPPQKSMHIILWVEVGIREPCKSRVCWSRVLWTASDSVSKPVTACHHWF